MTVDVALEIMQEAIGVAVRLSAPLLIISMAIGIIISILQAATQIHEQTITFVPKLMAIAITLVVAGPWMLTTLSDFVHRVFELIIA